MPAFAKFNQFAADVSSGVHQMQTGTAHVYKAVLSNVAPTSSNALLSDITEIANGNGYATGGISCGTVTGAQASGTFKLTLATSPVWTSSGAGMAVFRYIVLYNSTPTTPLKPLIGWWDYGSGLTLAVGETFTLSLDQANGVLTLV